jgi:hypothetical protein
MPLRTLLPLALALATLLGVSRSAHALTVRTDHPRRARRR